MSMCATDGCGNNAGLGHSVCLDCWHELTDYPQCPDCGKAVHPIEIHECKQQEGQKRAKPEQEKSLQERAQEQFDGWHYNPETGSEYGSEGILLDLIRDCIIEINTITTQSDQVSRDVLIVAANCLGANGRDAHDEWAYKQLKSAIDHDS